MWAALLGLILVCSTITFGAVGDDVFASPRSNPAPNARVEPHVEIPVAGYFERGDARYRPHLGGQLRGESFRGAWRNCWQAGRRRERHVAVSPLPRCSTATARSMPRNGPVCAHGNAAERFVFRWKGNTGKFQYNCGAALSPAKNSGYCNFHRPKTHRLIVEGPW